MSSMEHFPVDSGTQEEKKDSPEDSLRRSVVEGSVVTSQTVLERAEKEKQYKEEGLERNQERFEKYKEGVERARNDLDTHKSNFIRRILERKRTAELQAELGFREALLQDDERDRERTKELVLGYEKIIAEENEVNSLLEGAYKENAEFDERKQAEFREEESGRDVKNLIQKHNVFFIHDILLMEENRPSGNNNTLDTKSLTYKDQLNIVLGLDPTISVSTISPDSKNKTFANGGFSVLFSGGRVVGGESADAGTVAYGLRDRRISESSRTTEAISGAIDRVYYPGAQADKINSESYNELVLEQPEVAGVCFAWPGRETPEFNPEEPLVLQNEKGGRSYDRFWKILQESVSTGAPIFMREDNNNMRHVYDIDFTNRSFKVTPQYKPEMMTDLPGIYQQHLSPDARARAIREVLEKAPQIVPEEEKKLAEENPNYQGNSLNIH